MRYGPRLPAVTWPVQFFDIIRSVDRRLQSLEQTASEYRRELDSLPVAAVLLWCDPGAGSGLQGARMAPDACAC